MNQSDDIATVESEIDRIGRVVIQEELGVAEVTISVWKTRQSFPAHRRSDFDDMCRRRRIRKVPAILFHTRRKREHIEKRDALDAAE